MANPDVAKLRVDLAAAGFRRPDVTVAGPSWGDIRVTIRSADVRLPEVERIAAEYEVIRRDPSGDILSGGTSVTVAYDAAVSDPVKTQCLGRLAVAAPGVATVIGCFEVIRGASVNDDVVIALAPYWPPEGSTPATVAAYHAAAVRVSRGYARDLNMAAAAMARALLSLGVPVVAPSVAALERLTWIEDDAAVPAPVCAAAENGMDPCDPSHHARGVACEVCREPETVEVVIDSAAEHGRASDPDHEVGDLHDFIRILGTEAGAEVVRRAVTRYRIEHGEWRNGEPIEYLGADVAAAAPSRLKSGAVRP